jgi:hypothetical protein
VFKERDPIKAKGAKDWQQEKHLWDSFIENIKQVQHGGTKKQLATINEGLLQSNWVGLLDNSTTIQPSENNWTDEINQQLVI